MEIDRRNILAGATLSFASAFLPSISNRGFAANREQHLVSACRYADGRCAILVVTPHGRVVREIPLQGRGHDFAYHHHSGVVVAFARRPGRFAIAFNSRNISPPVLFAPPEDRHFYGHGTISPDGRLLYATENDFEAARGIIGVYDVEARFARIGELESYGVGPHDIVLLPDQKTLAIANGGIETHPDSGRAKLNLATMQPSLCFVDRNSGDLLSRHVVPKDNHQLSLRHLTVGRAGTVWFGCQWQGAHAATPALLGSASMNQPIALLEQSEIIAKPLLGYIGSVALSGNGRWLAASAPRAGCIVYFDMQTRGELMVEAIEDGCGLAPVNSADFAVSSGHGVLRRQSALTKAYDDRVIDGLSFDNHLRSLF